MSAEARFNAEKLRRASRQSAWITLVGVAIVGGALGVSLSELGEINTKVAAKQHEYDSLEVLSASMQKQIDVLRSNAHELEKSYAKLDTVVAASKSTKLKQAYDRATPLIAVVKPRARAVPAGSASSMRPMYDFSLWLEMPRDRRSEIDSVEYEFNHPTFTQPTLLSANPEDGFRVRYHGWGCLNSVIVTIHLRNGNTRTIDFDMCEAVQLGNRPRS